MHRSARDKLGGGSSLAPPPRTGLTLTAAMGTARLMIKRDHYMVLGVPRTAETREIRTAFKARALERHPDRAGSDATDEFQRLSDAYHVLADPKRRAAYDRELDRREIIASCPVVDLRGPPPRARPAGSFVEPVFGEPLFRDFDPFSDAVEGLFDRLFRDFGGPGERRYQRMEPIDVVFGVRR
jgi:DnaJ-class molecular chaperone